MNRIAERSPKGIAAADRRTHPRVAVSLELDVSSGSNFYSGRTRDLSVGGLFLEGPFGLPHGELVRLSLELHGRRHDLVATVAWQLCEADGAVVGLGLEFGPLSPVARAAIEAFMEERAPVPFECTLDGDGRPGPPRLPSSRGGAP